MTRVFILLVLCAIAAQAGPRESAEALRRVEQGNKLYEGGRYEDALRLYLAAYELAPNPDTLFNVGLAHEKMLAFEQCAVAFGRYLAEGKDAAAKERAAERHARCRERARVPVKVSSIPPGAAVSLAVGSEAATFRGRTPTQLDLAPGSYKIKVEMPGFVAMEQTVNVDVGARPEVDFPLEKLSSIAIESDPAGATVQIDDAPATATPFRRELRAGTYKIRLRKAGFRDAERDVAIAAGEQATLVLSLTGLPAVRDLAVQIAPHGQVKIDGHLVTKSIRLVAGGYRLEADAPGRVPFAGDVSIPNDRGAILDIQLTPKRSLLQKAVLLGLAGVAAGALVAGSVYGSMALDAQREFDRMPSVGVADRGESH